MEVGETAFRGCSTLLPHKLRHIPRLFLTFVLFKHKFLTAFWIA